MHHREAPDEEALAALLRGMIVEGGGSGEEGGAGAAAGRKGSAAGRLSGVNPAARPFLWPHFLALGWSQFFVT